jgi:hypothetical protein
MVKAAFWGPNNRGDPDMNNDEMMDSAYLLERAAQCRRLARQALSIGIANELEKLACDYDRDAARLEASTPGLPIQATMAIRAAAAE